MLQLTVIVDCLSESEMKFLVQLSTLLLFSSSLEASEHYDDGICESQLKYLDAALDRRESWALSSK